MTTAVTNAATRSFNIGVRSGFRVGKDEVPAFVTILNEIAKELGTPGEVPAKAWRIALIEKARPEDSPIHHKFTWNDAVAGEKYRRYQAAYYIRAFDFQYIDERGNKSPKVRWLPTIELVKGTHGKRAPIAMSDALSNQRAIDSLVETALREMQSWVRRYESLESVAKLAPIFQAARKALKQHEEKSAKKK